MGVDKNSQDNALEIKQGDVRLTPRQGDYIPGEGTWNYGGGSEYGSAHQGGGWG